MTTPEKEPLQFQSLNKGMGFHPFEEGLPYVPHSPKKTIKPAAQTAPSTSITPVYSSIHPAPARPAPQVQSTESVFKAVGFKPKVEKISKKVALRRSLAFLFDLVFHFSLFALIYGAAGQFIEVPLTSFYRGGALPITLALFFMLHLSFLATEEVCFGTSLGKNLFRLKLEGSVNQIFFRALLFPIGFGQHERLSGARVEEK